MLKDIFDLQTKQYIVTQDTFPLLNKKSAYSVTGNHRRAKALFFF